MFVIVCVSVPDIVKKQLVVRDIRNNTVGSFIGGLESDRNVLLKIGTRKCNGK